MSDKTREQVRKDFESQILKSIKYANLERDALSDYISPFTLASWQSWQAAHEMYAPKQCKWERDPNNEDFYDTECHGEFFIPDGLGDYNSVKHCCYCGGNIVDATTETGEC